MINKCSNEKELAFFDHQSAVIRPIHISLEVGQTILIGGIVRIDVKEVGSTGASLALMTTSHFPINVIRTKGFDDFYQKALEKNQLGVKLNETIRLEPSFVRSKVPQNRVNGRLQDPPELRGPTVEIVGIGEDRSASDIVLSSAGKFLRIVSGGQCLSRSFRLVQRPMPSQCRRSTGGENAGRIGNSSARKTVVKLFVAFARRADRRDAVRGENLSE